MNALGSLICFGLRQVIDLPAEDVLRFVQDRLSDHSQRLPKALARANDRSWKALALALGGDGWLDRLKGWVGSDADERGFRDQVRTLLGGAALPAADAAFRQSCLAELHTLRKAGRLKAEAVTPSDLAGQTGALRRYADAPGLVAGAQAALASVAAALAPEAPNLSRLLAASTGGDPPLLAAAFAFFFRREVETDQELATGLMYDGQRQLFTSQKDMLARLEQLSASQATALDQVGLALDGLGERFDQAVDTVLAGLDQVRREIRDLREELVRRLTEAGMQRGEVRPQHSFSIRGEDEHRAVLALLARFRQLPADEQRRMPDLLNGLGKLQLGTGDFGGARESFDRAAAATTDAAAKAEARFNAYRAALEQRKWDQALAELTEAAALAPGRFNPFPMQRYEPKRILGAGGFGTAFLCYDRHFDEDVVIKTLHTGDLDRGIDDVFREARMLRRLSHPAIIAVRDCEDADPTAKARPYLVMDYFPGGTLEQFVELRGPLTPAQLGIVAAQVARGMQAAHSQRIYHRDLKPANVLVRKEGDRWKVKIIDFGLALRSQTRETSMARASSHETVQGRSVAGTVQYAPPEQMGRLPGIKPGPYSDVYAFGKTCCYALFKTTEPKSRHWASVPKELADALERCIEQELEYRYPSFDPVLSALEAIVRVDPPPPTATNTTVTSSVNPAAYGQAVLFTVAVRAVSSATATPTGTVTLMDGAVVLGSVQLNSGTATLRTSALSAGSHGITVRYEGDGRFAPSTSASLTQTVNPAPLTVTRNDASKVQPPLSPAQRQPGPAERPNQHLDGERRQGQRETPLAGGSPHASLRQASQPQGSGSTGSQPPYIGIDFGTSNSIVACFRGGRAVVIPNHQGQLWTPSVVTLRQNGTLAFGQEAKENFDENRSIRSIKRILGTPERVPLNKSPHEGKRQRC